MPASPNGSFSGTSIDRTASICSLSSFQSAASSSDNTQKPVSIFDFFQECPSSASTMNNHSQEPSKFVVADPSALFFFDDPSLNTACPLNGNLDAFISSTNIQLGQYALPSPSFPSQNSPSFQPQNSPSFQSQNSPSYCPSIGSTSSAANASSNKKRKQDEKEMSRDELLEIVQDKRRRNTESARRSRERKLNRLAELEKTVDELTKENERLKRKLAENGLL